ncbi:hypothetical protein U1Q18_000850 [Sarracenia purpurea var. burkii]
MVARGDDLSKIRLASLFGGIVTTVVIVSVRSVDEHGSSSSTIAKKREGEGDTTKEERNEAYIKVDGILFGDVGSHELLKRLWDERKEVNGYAPKA